MSVRNIPRQSRERIVRSGSEHLRALGMGLTYGFLELFGTLPLLIVLLPLFSYSSQVHLVVFLLVYMMVLSFLILFFSRLWRTSKELVKETRETRTPPKIDSDITARRERARIAREHFTQTSVDLPYSDIGNRNDVYVAENAEYVRLAIKNTVYYFGITWLALAVLIWSGYFPVLIDAIRSVDSSVWSIAGDALRTVFSLFMIVVEAFFPDLNLENRVVVGVLLIAGGWPFYTAAVNMLAIVDKYHYRLLNRFYVENGWVRGKISLAATAMMLFYLGLLVVVT